MDTAADLNLQTRDGGILLPVQAHPKAKRDAITGIHSGRLKVSITQAPEQGKANTAIIQLLSQSLGLKKSQFELQSGATSREKVLRVTGVTEAELRERVALALG